MKLLHSFMDGLQSMEERSVELRRDVFGLGVAAAFHH